MTGIAAGITTGGDWMMWGTLAMLGTLGLVAVWSDRWFRTKSSDA